jgi:HK97 family phage major capsid protein
MNELRKNLLWLASFYGMPTQQGAVNVEDLQNKLIQIRDSMKTLQNAADAESRDLNDDEQKQFDDLDLTFQATEREIERRNKLAALEVKLAVPQPRKTAPEPDEEDLAAQRTAALGSRARVTGGELVGASKGTGGWRSFGEFMVGIRKAVGGKVDPRLYNAPATFGSETNADGGYAIPPDFRAAIMKLVEAEDSVLPMTDRQTTSSNQITVPVDAATPWGASGPNANWIDEGTDITLSKPALTTLTVKAYKLAVLVPMTDELLEDAPSMSNYLTSKVPDKFVSAINTAIISGNGTGKPTGMMNSASKITQAAESAQGAGTIVAKNIIKMWSRMYAPLRQRAVWFINQDCEQQLLLLAMPGTAPQVPLFMPPGGLSDRPYATIMGRPVMSLEACSTVGTEGDIILAAPQSYLTVTKTSGMRQDVSMHVYFASDHQAFRFIFRLGGQSWWAGALTRQNGGNTLSNIITLNSTRT